LPGLLRQQLLHLMDHLKALYRQVNEIEAEIKTWQRRNDLSFKAEKIPGMRPSPLRRWSQSSAMRSTFRMVDNWRHG
jgi:hypothetical protein